MNQSSQTAAKDVARTSSAQKKAGMAVVAGLAGAAAGATLGVALSNKKNRDQLMKLATEARDALEKFMTDLQSNVEEVDLREVKDNVKKKAEEATKRLKG